MMNSHIRVNKAAVAVGMNVFLWTILIWTSSGSDTLAKYSVNVSTTLFFVLVALLGYSAGAAVCLILF